MAPGCGTMTARGKMRWAELVGGIVPDDGQLTAQQSCAAVTSGVSAVARALAQQSMPPLIPCMLHSCSLECSGIPASALPPSAAIRIRDVSHFAIASQTVLEGLDACQG